MGRPSFSIKVSDITRLSTFDIHIVYMTAVTEVEEIII